MKKKQKRKENKRRTERTERRTGKNINRSEDRIEKENKSNKYYFPNSRIKKDRKKGDKEDGCSLHN